MNVKLIIFSLLLFGGTNSSADSIYNFNYTKPTPGTSTTPAGWELFSRGHGLITLKYPTAEQFCSTYNIGVCEYRKTVTLTLSNVVGSYVGGLQPKREVLQAVTPGTTHIFRDVAKCTASWPVVGFYYDHSMRLINVINFGYAFVDDDMRVTRFRHVIPAKTAFQRIHRVAIKSGTCEIDSTQDKPG